LLDLAPLSKAELDQQNAANLAMAEPISLLYEKNRVLHRRGLDQLEMEMMSFSREWDRAVDGSPNRLDAMTWVLTRLSKIITQIPIA
jgi:phage terminase large subunit-like protein